MPQRRCLRRSATQQRGTLNHHVSRHTAKLSGRQVHGHASNPTAWHLSGVRNGRAQAPPLLHLRRFHPTHNAAACPLLPCPTSRTERAQRLARAATSQPAALRTKWCVRATAHPSSRFPGGGEWVNWVDLIQHPIELICKCMPKGLCPYPRTHCCECMRVLPRRLNPLARYVR